jgi:hypothetical protein
MEIEAQPSKFRLSHPDKIMMMGSCFVENISPKMIYSGFQVDVNPFGIAYNPISVADGLYDLINNKIYTGNILFNSQGVYHSLHHHSRFSGIDKDVVLEQINFRIKQSSLFLKKADTLIVSFGTARIYRLITSGEVVSNCHKLPVNRFREERLTVEQIVRYWNELIQCLRTFNPDLKLLFVVSPIRHWKNGAHENQLSKATLLLSVDELIATNDRCYYFPSYEIMMDDLRDYRFYSVDMIHPSQQAIDYIWEKFSKIYFDAKTLSIIQEWDSIQKALNHRALHPDSEEYKSFMVKTKKRKESFLEANPSFRNL